MPRQKRTSDEVAAFLRRWQLAGWWGNDATDADRSLAKRQRAQGVDVPRHPPGRKPHAPGNWQELVK